MLLWDSPMNLVLCLEEKISESVTLTVDDLNQEPALRHTVIVFKFNSRYSNVPGAAEHSIQERVNPAQTGTWDKGGGLTIFL